MQESFIPLSDILAAVCGAATAATDTCLRMPRHLSHSKNRRKQSNIQRKFVMISVSTGFLAMQQSQFSWTFQYFYWLLKGACARHKINHTDSYALTLEVTQLLLYFLLLFSWKQNTLKWNESTNTQGWSIKKLYLEINYQCQKNIAKSISKEQYSLWGPSRLQSSQLDLHLQTDISWWSVDFLHTFSWLFTEC